MLWHQWVIWLGLLVVSGWTLEVKLCLRQLFEKAGSMELSKLVRSIDFEGSDGAVLVEVLSSPLSGSLGIFSSVYQSLIKNMMGLCKRQGCTNRQFDRLLPIELAQDDFWLGRQLLDAVASNQEWTGTIGSLEFKPDCFLEDEVRLLRYLLERPRHLVSPRYCQSIFFPHLRTDHSSEPDTAYFERGLWQLYDAPCVKASISSNAVGGIDYSDPLSRYIRHLVSLGRKDNLLALVRLSQVTRVLEETAFGPPLLPLAHDLFDSLTTGAKEAVGGGEGLRELGVALKQWASPSVKGERAEGAFAILSRRVKDATGALSEREAIRFSLELAVEAASRGIVPGGGYLEEILESARPENTPAYLLKSLLKWWTRRGNALPTSIGHFQTSPFVHHFIPLAFLPLPLRRDIWALHSGVRLVRRGSEHLVGPNVVDKMTAKNVDRPFVNLLVRSPPDNPKQWVLWVDEIIRAAEAAQRRFFPPNPDDGESDQQQQQQPHLRYDCSQKFDATELANFFVGSSIAAAFYGAPLPSLHGSLLGQLRSMGTAEADDGAGGGGSLETLVAQNCRQTGCPNLLNFVNMLGVASATFRKWDLFNLYGIPV